jgi:hypothetical protein
MCTVLLPPGVNPICAVLLPPGVNTIAVKYIIILIFPGGKGGQCVGLNTLPHSSADLLNLEASTSWNTQDLSGALQ